MTATEVNGGCAAASGRGSSRTSRDLLLLRSHFDLPSIFSPNLSAFDPACEDELVQPVALTVAALSPCADQAVDEVPQTWFGQGRHQVFP